MTTGPCVVTYGPSCGPVEKGCERLAKQVLRELPVLVPRGYTTRMLRAAGPMVRFYVDGNSWGWPYAVGVLADWGGAP